MTEAPLEGEEAGQELRELTLKQTQTASGCLTIQSVCVILSGVFYHHGDERAEGQSADGGHDAAESQQAERTETRPADRTVCTETRHGVTD